MKKTYKKIEEKLTSEGTELRQPVAELEALETDYMQTGQLLRKTEVDKLDVLNNISEFVIHQDTEHKILWTNRAAAESVGLTPEQLVERHCYEIWLQRSQPCEGCPVAKARQTGKPQQAEITIPGDRILFIRGYPILDKYDRVTGIIEVTLDITERKQAEQALRQSEQRYRNLYELSPLAVVTVDKKGVITSCNAATLSYTGYSEDEIVGKHFIRLPFHHLSDIPKYIKLFNMLLRGKAPKPFEINYSAEDGASRWVQAHIGFLGASGSEDGFQVAFEEITERKQAEEALQAEKNKLQSVIGAIEYSLTIQDKEYNIIYQNVLSRRSSSGSRIGEKCHRVYEGRDKVCDGCPVEKAFKDGKSHTAERQRLMPSGDITFWENTANPIRDASGKIVSCLEVGRDITERKRAEEREQEMQRELLLSSRLAAIGELAAGVAHQINNPLTGVLGFSQRLLKKSTDQETKQDLKIIYTEAERAAKVVQNLLTFARRRQPHKQYSDINEILESALELRSYELKTSNIEVITNLAARLPEIMLDFYQLQEVFLNLILNAEQALTEAHNGGNLTIKTEERKGYIRTTFTDDGPGIPAERLDNIFDPFYTTKAEKGGTGLGLSICHGIITEHGGKIYAKSKPGKGATFFVKLPLTHN